MFCKECGRNISNHRICPYCHTLQGSAASQDFIDFDTINIGAKSKRSKLIAGFLQIFLGSFGIGRFYLGYKKIAFLQIAASIFTFGIAGFVWGFVDGLMIINGREKYDGSGKILA